MRAPLPPTYHRSSTGGGRSLTIALATSTGIPASDQDEGPLLAALHERGLDAVLAEWSDPDIDWSGFACVVVRSTWDYTERRDDFVAWADHVGEVTQLWNPPEVLRWNTHKSYLIELEERGAPVIPTAWLGRGDRIDLAALLESRHWKRAVVKPAVGAGAEGLLLVEPHAVELAQHHLDALLRRGDVMVQPFLESIAREGELSVAVIDGEHSHTIRKRPALGELRSQIEFGATYERIEPDRELVDLATWIVGSTGHPVLYARVDLLLDDDGTPQLSELEVTEPSLYLTWAPDGAARLAAAIERRL